MAGLGAEQAITAVKWGGAPRAALARGVAGLLLLPREALVIIP